jgi:hypothetical protein
VIVDLRRSVPLQLHQFLLLGFLLVLGKQYAYLVGEWPWIVGLLAWGCLFENGWLFVRYGARRRWSWSPCSTAIGIVLMIFASHVFVYFAALTAGLVQKHLLRCCDRHGFNPSNFALIFALTVFGNEAGLITGQLGESPWLLGAVLAAAVSVLVRARRWIIPLVFIVAYVGAQALWTVRYDPTLLMWDVVMRFESVSFVVFVVFMLTDPRVTPSRPSYQAAFGLFVAVGATLLDRWLGFRVLHLFAVLFVLSPWVMPVEVPASSRGRALRFSVIAFLLAASAIIYLENRPPLHFEMVG